LPDLAGYLAPDGFLAELQAAGVPQTAPDLVRVFNENYFLSADDLLIPGNKD
jgi:hypothetical protein